MIAVTVTSTHIGPYEVHPLCQTIPDIPDDQWAKFRNSIGEGLQKPIVRWEGKIINGRQRLRACLETGIPPKFFDWQPRGKTSSEIDAEIRRLIKIEDLDRRQLDKGETALALARLFPPRERGRPPQAPAKSEDKNAQNCAINRTSDADLADAAGISRRNLQQAREMLKGCIDPVIKAVDSKKFGHADASNIARLSDGEQLKILKLAFKEECSLTAAMRSMHARNPEIKGASVKTKMHLVRIEEWVPAETPDLAVDSAKRMALDLLERRGIDPDKYPPIVSGVGLKVGGIKSFVPCVRCGFLLYDATPQKKTPEGPACKECPDGRARD